MLEECFFRPWMKSKIGVNSRGATRTVTGTCHAYTNERTKCRDSPSPNHLQNCHEESRHTAHHGCFQTAQNASYGRNCRKRSQAWEVPPAWCTRFLVILVHTKILPPQTSYFSGAGGAIAVSLKPKQTCAPPPLQHKHVAPSASSCSSAAHRSFVSRQPVRYRYRRAAVCLPKRFLTTQPFILHGRVARRLV